MASSIPSFVKQSSKFEELFNEDDDVVMETPLAAIPISRSLNPPTSVQKTGSSSKRKICQSSTELIGSPSVRPQKRSRYAQPKEVEVSDSSSKVRLFSRMVEDQVPEEAITEWSRMKLTEAAKAMSLATAQSHFLNLRFGEQLVEVARGDLELKEEVRQLRAELKANEEKEKKFIDAGKKLRTSESVLTKEKMKLLAQVSTLEHEKEVLVASHEEKANELQLQVDALQNATNTFKSTRLAREKAKYQTDHTNDIKDFMRATFLKMPDLDCSLLGEDVVASIGEIKQEVAAQELEEQVPQEAEAAEHVAE